MLQPFIPQMRYSDFEARPFMITCHFRGLKVILGHEGVIMMPRPDFHNKSNSYYKLALDKIGRLAHLKSLSYEKLGEPSIPRLIPRVYYYNIHKSFLVNAKCTSWISLRPSLSLKLSFPPHLRCTNITATPQRSQ